MLVVAEGRYVKPHLVDGPDRRDFVEVVGDHRAAADRVTGRGGEGRGRVGAVLLEGGRQTGGPGVRARLLEGPVEVTEMEDLDVLEVRLGWGLLEVDDPAELGICRVAVGIDRLDCRAVLLAALDQGHEGRGLVSRHLDRAGSREGVDDVMGDRRVGRRSRFPGDLDAGLLDLRLDRGRGRGDRVGDLCPAGTRDPVHRERQSEGTGGDHREHQQVQGALS